MRHTRRNIDEDDVPASGGTSISDPSSYNNTIKVLQERSSVQIKNFATLATYAEQMKYYIKIFVSELEKKKDKKSLDKAKNIIKLLKEFEEWQSGR